MLKGEARLFSFIVTKEEAKPIAELDLPSEARVICYYRQDKFILPEKDSMLVTEDEVVVLTHSGNLGALQERFKPKPAEKIPEDKKTEGQ